MAKVLVLSLVYRPDTVSTANLVGEIVDSLRDKGHEMIVLTSIPHYNPAPELRRNRAYSTSLFRWYTETQENGVRVFRIAMPRKGGRQWLRLFDYMWLHAFSTVIALLRVRRADIIFVPSPPPTLGVNGYVIAKLLSAKLIYDVREVWTDLPIKIGKLRRRIVIGTLHAIESFVYRKSVAITSIARSFNQALVRRGVPPSKLFFTPNFVDVQWLQPSSHDTEFARQHGISGKFVIFYAGNIGLTQGLEILLRVAELVEKRAPDAVIVIVGDGAARGDFEKRLRESGLSNVLLLPFQPYSRVPETYATAHVCVSPMKRGFSYNTVPSKMYTAMAAGRPVVAASESDTETAELLTQAEAGIIVSPESAEEMAEQILKLYADRDLLRTMGENARRAVMEQYSREAVVATYDHVLRTVTAT